MKEAMQECNVLAYDVRKGSQSRNKIFTQCILEVLDNGSLPGTVFPLHVVGWHKARFVGGVPDPPPGLGVVEKPEALILLDVKLLVLLGHVIKLGDDNHLFRHLARDLQKRTRRSGQYF